MDSFTQIVLGAACGEAVAGKKLGNRALLWGAVGGTLPDLDVFATFFTDEITATAFHRGFMHSFAFAALAPWLLAHLAQWFYGKGVYQRKGYKTAAMSIWILLSVGAAVGINLIPIALGGGPKWYLALPTLTLCAWLIYRLWRDYAKNTLQAVEMPYFSWVSLFFWSIFTHPILDCFTNWGTQIWQPFSDLRVQWSTVSVVDPLATLPFALALVVLSRFSKENERRKIINWIGLAWFCGYLVHYTVGHKKTVGQYFEQALQARSIQYKRTYSNPTLFNNLFWYAVAEGDTAYYAGYFSFNDPIRGFQTITTLPKNHELLRDVAPDAREMKFVRWFSDGFYNVVQRKDGHLQINDLRFGFLGESVKGPESYVVPFVVDDMRGGELKIHTERNVEESKATFPYLWARIKGEQQPKSDLK